jgi:hypothetical protein
MGLQDIPRWPPGLGKAQITAEMQQERQAVIDNNRVIREKAKHLQEDWMQNKWFPVYRQFLLNHGRVAQEPLYLLNTLGGRHPEPIYYEIITIEQI